MNEMPEMEPIELKLRAIYSSASDCSQFELAQLENQLWQFVRSTHFGSGGSGPVGRRSEWFHARFGVPGNHIELRCTLLSCGDWIQPLWHLIDQKKITLKEACNTVVKIRRENLPSDHLEALQRFVSQLQTDPGARAALSTLSTSTKKGPAVPAADSRQFMEQISRCALNLINASLQDLVLDSQVQELVTDFTYEIRLCCEELIRQVQRQKRSVISIQIQFSHADIIRACEHLGIPSPRRGQCVNLDEAKVAYRKLSKRFHPDRTGNNPQLTEQFREIQRSWNFLQDISTRRP